jgi:tRNA pseudouridine synthase 10
MVGKRSYGLTNDQRGKALRISYFIALDEPYHNNEGVCWICQNFFDGIDVWANRVISAFNNIDFETFLIGTRIPPLMAESEEMVWSDLSLSHAEPLKSEINREVGKTVSEKTGKEANLAHPDVIAILNPLSGNVEVQINPVFFSGRYRKLERGIPQTHWNCRICKGKGCEHCGFTGKQYQDSVEELIGRTTIRLFSAKAGHLGRPGPFGSPDWRS